MIVYLSLMYCVKRKCVKVQCERVLLKKWRDEISYVKLRHHQSSLPCQG